MPSNRPRPAGPDGPAATEPEIITLLFTLPGAGRADDMAVIVRMRLFIALLVGPLIAITGTTGRWQVTALVLAAAAAARATRAAHRPIRTV